MEIIKFNNLQTQDADEQQDCKHYETNQSLHLCCCQSSSYVKRPIYKEFGCNYNMTCIVDILIFDNVINFFQFNSLKADICSPVNDFGLPPVR